jgi:hypothetical protein
VAHLRAWPSPTFPPFPRLGRAGSRPVTARLCSPVSPLSLADTVGPPIRAAFLLKTPVGFLSKTITDQILRLNLFFPYMEHPWAIYFELMHPFAPSYLEAMDRRRPEEATLELQSEPSAIPSSTPSPGRLRLRLLPWSARLVPHSILMLFFHEATL